MTVPSVWVEVVERDRLTCRVQIGGDIDIATVGLLRSALSCVLEQLSPGERVVVDAAGVGFLSAGGVRALAEFSERARAGGGGLVIETASSIVERVLRVCRHVDLMGLPERSAPQASALLSTRTVRAAP